MAGLRATNLSRLNTENEAAHNRLLNQKAVAGGGRTTRARLAMTDIANQAVLKPALRAKDTNIVKPPRMLVKQKGTTSLKALSTAQPPKPLIDENIATKLSARNRKRKVSVKIEDEPMEVEEVSGLLPDEIKMDVGSPPGFSTTNLAKFGIEDIDVEDVDDPQLVVQYVNEVYEYLRHLENVQSIRKGYLDDRAGVILPKMRSVLVDWLVEVHQQFSLLQETLYLSVAILDRFMQVYAEKVPRKQLQLVGVTAMFIAAKYEEMYAPEIGDFVYITDSAYSQSQIREMEIKMMQVLLFDLGRPLPLHFLRRNSKAGQVDATAHTMAKYVMELTLVEYDFVHVPPSEVAAASLAFSLKVLDDDDTPMETLWSPTVAYYSQYSLEALKPTIQSLANIVFRTSRALPEKSKLTAIRKKYSNRKFGKIAEFSELSGPAAENLAEGIF